MPKKTYTKNAKHSIPPISYKTKDGEREYMETDVNYSFSYNPELQPKEGRPILWAPYYNHMVSIFYSLNYCTIKVNSEFGAYGRWHFHGCIMLTDVMKFYIYDLPKLRKHGALEIDTIEDPDKWEDYCDKEQHLVNSFLSELKAVGSIDTSMPNPIKCRKVNGGTPQEYERMLQRMDILDSDTESEKSFDSDNGKWNRKIWEH